MGCYSTGSNKTPWGAAVVSIVTQCKAGRFQEPFDLDSFVQR